MKICSQLVALSVFHPNVWGTVAFSARGPEVPTGGFSTRTGAFDVSGKQRYEYSFPQAPNSGLTQPISERNPSNGFTANSSSRGQRPQYDVSVKPMDSITNVWDTLKPIVVQGGSLRTWSFATPAIRRVQVMLKTVGRPLRAKVELWQGPDNTPQKMEIYNEDGCLRPFNAVIETPRGQNSIAIRNTGQMEFPLFAGLAADVQDSSGRSSRDLSGLTKTLSDMCMPRVIQGGALHTYPFDGRVQSVQIMLKTDGRPLHARIELLQGPNNNKQIINLYCENGDERPFFAVIETPGSGNVVRIVNTGTLEYPLTARVEPYTLAEYSAQESGNNEHFILDGQH